MHLVQLLLPLKDNDGNRLPASIYAGIQRELTERFSGLTAYSRAPADGLWKPRRKTRHDEIVVYEVMVQKFHLGWWRKYRARLEKLLRQESVVIREQPMRLI